MFQCRMNISLRLVGQRHFFSLWVCQCLACRYRGPHPHKVGGGVTSWTVVTCAVRDRQSGAVQLGEARCSFGIGTNCGLFLRSWETWPIQRGDYRKHRHAVNCGRNTARGTLCDLCASVFLPWRTPRFGGFSAPAGCLHFAKRTVGVVRHGIRVGNSKTNAASGMA